MARNETASVTLRMVATDLMSGKVGKAIGSIDRLAKRGGIVGSIFQGVGLSMGQMLNPITLITRGFGALTGVIGEAGAAARAEQANREQLSASLKASIAGWDGNTDALEQYFSLQQKQLAFADTDQRTSMAAFVAVTNDVTKAMELQGLAFDLARFKGIELKSATDILVRVYGGSLGALSRYGIIVEKGATKTEALAEIQKMASGQAEKFGATNQAAAERADFAWGDAMEAIGESLTPIQRQWDDFMADVATGVSDVLAGPDFKTLQFRGAIDAYDETARAIKGADEEGQGLFSTLLDLSRPELFGPQDVEFLKFWEDWASLAKEAGLEQRTVQLQFFRLKDDLGKGAQGAREIITTELSAMAASANEAKVAMKGAAIGIEDVGVSSGQSAEELRKLVDGLDLAKGSFASFWEKMRADQKRIAYFIRNPDKVQQELDQIERKIERAEKQKQKLLADGFQEGDALALAAIDRRLAKLRGRRGQFTALGKVYGNAAEAGMERAFDPTLIAKIKTRFENLPPALRGRGGGTAPRPGGWDGDPRTPWPTAKGGFRPAGALTLVGEKGPELRVEPSSAIYLDAQKTSVLMGGAATVGGATRTVNVTVNVDNSGATFLGTEAEAQQWADKAGPAMVRWMRAQNV